MRSQTKEIENRDNRKEMMNKGGGSDYKWYTKERVHFPAELREHGGSLSSSSKSHCLFFPCLGQALPRGAQKSKDWHIS